MGRAVRATDGGRDRPRTAVRTTALLRAVLATTAMVVPFVGVGAAQAAPPVAACEVNEPFPEPGEDVTLDASDSSDPDGRELAYSFPQRGVYEVGLTVTGDGRVNIVDVAVLLDLT